MVAGVRADVRAVGVGAGARGCLGGAGRVGAPRAGLPARRECWAVEAEAVGLLLPEPDLLQVGDLSPAKTENREGESHLLGLGGLTSASPLYACAPGPFPTHAHLPEPCPQPNPNLPLPTLPTGGVLRLPLQALAPPPYPTQLETPAHLG